MTIVLVIALAVGVLYWLLHPGERDHMLSWHRANGQYQVLYPDGKLSQPFSLKTAKDYKAIFGGVVIKKKG